MDIKKMLTALVFLAQGLFAVPVELTWSRHPDLDVTGYIAYWGTSTPFSDSMDVGKVERALIDNLQAGQSYLFAVRAYDRSRNLGALSSTLNFNTGPGVGITAAAARGSRPAFTALPNPFSNQLTLVLPDASQGGRLTILNVNGQRLMSSAIAAAAGQQRLFWNGRDQAGSRLPAGIYLLSVRLGHKIHTQRVLLAR